MTVFWLFVVRAFFCMLAADAGRSDRDILTFSRGGYLKGRSSDLVVGWFRPTALGSAVYERYLTHYMVPYAKWLQSERMYSTVFIQFACVLVLFFQRKQDSKAQAPRFPKNKDEGWFLVLGEVDRKELLAVKRVGYVRHHSAVSVAFYTPERTGKWAAVMRGGVRDTHTHTLQGENKRCLCNFPISTHHTPTFWKEHIPNDLRL